LKKLAIEIVKKSIGAVFPDRAVKETLPKLNLDRVILVAVGKAAWRMAKAAYEVLGEKIRKGVVVTKYGHSEGLIDDFEIYEAGHPVPDENTIKATERVLELVDQLNENDTVLFLLSGGGSSLFELPAEGVSLEEIQKLTSALLKSGASIEEINTVRKHLSQVKGGRFAERVFPAKVVALVLSDVLGDRLDVIASGPAWPDNSTSEDALKVLERYGIEISESVKRAILRETPKHLSNVEIDLIGNVQKVCDEAKKLAKEKGFNAEIITTSLDCEAREAGRFIASIMKEVKFKDRPLKKPAARNGRSCERKRHRRKKPRTCSLGSDSPRRDRRSDSVFSRNRWNGRPHRRSWRNRGWKHGKNAESNGRRPLPVSGEQRFVQRSEKIWSALDNRTYGNERQRLDNRPHRLVFART